MDVWDVLGKRTADDEWTLVGGVKAPDADMALLLARETHFRHKEGVAYAVRRRGDARRAGPWATSRPRCSAASPTARTAGRRRTRASARGCGAWPSELAERGLRDRPSPAAGPSRGRVGRVSRRPRAGQDEPCFGSRGISQPRKS